jgi:hypothetical protein
VVLLKVFSVRWGDSPLPGEVRTDPRQLGEASSPPVRRSSRFLANPGSVIESQRAFVRARRKPARWDIASEAIRRMGASRRYQRIERTDHSQAQIVIAEKGC